METIAIDVPVTIKHNGLASFVPPCFCWDLVGASGSIVAVVSAVELDNQGDRFDNARAVEVIQKKFGSAVGVIVEYDVEGGSGQKGRRFIARFGHSAAEPRKQSDSGGRQPILYVDPFGLLEIPWCPTVRCVDEELRRVCREVPPHAVLIGRGPNGKPCRCKCI